MGIIELKHSELTETDASALDWIGRFYADVQVEPTPFGVRLASVGRSNEELLLLWRTGVLNERNYEITGGNRRADIVELGQ